LKTLTRVISGDERPKQFCPIIGGASLLAQTRARLERTAAPGRTLFVVVREHERFYEGELADVNPSRIFVQPSNKGTTPAIASVAFHLACLDDDAIVGFFPTDHYFGDENQFTAAVESACEAAKDYPELVILLGAEARQAEDQYGWIEPGAGLEGRSSRLFRVNRFWEKPSAPIARALLNIGCLWNTFIMIGSVRAFLRMIESALPDVSETFESFGRRSAVGRAKNPGSDLYHVLAEGDFSRQVLAVCSDRLAVLRLRDIAWNDLGTPERIFATLARAGITPHWKRDATRGANCLR
jgi:mannose-1-phosphate guanylyltransferase